MKKIGGFEGDEPIDTFIEDPNEPPRCRLSRAGRIIFEPEENTEDDELDAIIPQERDHYRKLKVSNEKRSRHQFASEDSFGFEMPDDDENIN